MLIIDPGSLCLTYSSTDEPTIWRAKQHAVRTTDSVPHKSTDKATYRTTNNATFEATDKTTDQTAK
jgi:hypothetical protein